ncbi:MAG: DsbE family thiol:disulfide interchange protein [Gammaproteobacteria bacterium]|nr:DsbE family thiol:disulfide interchange protein [Gammaproteobacteria bacterium]
MSKRGLFARPKFLIPFIVFVAVAGFFAAGLRLDSTVVPSPLIGKVAPAFTLPVLGQGNLTLSTDQLAGGFYVLNVWASWCIACRDEHAILVDLSEMGVPIAGLNYKDKAEDAHRWLRDWGNPYFVTVVDQDGAVAIDWGVYGVPETFVVDAQGVIRYKHIGPITPEVVEREILSLWNASKQPS